jgi:hypothetical protein
MQAGMSQAPAVVDRLSRLLRWLVEHRLFVLVFVTYAYFHQGSDPNQSTRFLLMRAIVERHAPDITPWHTLTIDKGYKDGKFYCDKAPGASLLGVVPYAIMLAADRVFHVDATKHPAQRVKLHVLSILLSALPGTLAAYFTFQALLVLDVERRRATLLTGGYALGSLMFPFSTVLFGHTLAAACIAGALLLLLRWRRADGETTPRRSAILGLVLATSVVFEYPSGMLGAVLGANYISWGPWRSRRVLGIAGWTLAGAALPIAIHSLFLLWAYGSPFTLPYKYLIEPVFLAHTSGGILGIGIPTKVATYGATISRYRGVFFLCPFLALTFAGIGLWLKSGEHRRELFMVVGAMAIYLLFCCSYYAWDGGGSAGPRHLVPALTFFVLPIAYVVRGKAWRIGGTAALALVSAAIMFACTATLVHLPEDDPWSANPLYDVVLPALMRGRLGLNVQDAFYPRFQSDVTYNLGTLFGLSAAASLAVLPAVWALAYAPDVLRRRAT